MEGNLRSLGRTPSSSDLPPKQLGSRVLARYLVGLVAVEVAAATIMISEPCICSGMFLITSSRVGHTLDMQVLRVSVPKRPSAYVFSKSCRRETEAYGNAD